MKLRLLGISALLTGVSLFAAGTAGASKHDDDHKVHKSYVCKYVGTPGVDERLQTGQNPIWVDNSALTGKDDDDDVKVGDAFSDKHGRSVVIVANTKKLTPEPGVDRCPPPDVPPTTTTTAVTTTTVEDTTTTVEVTTTTIQDTTTTVEDTTTTVIDTTTTLPEVTTTTVEVSTPPTTTLPTTTTVPGGKIPVAGSGSTLIYLAIVFSFLGLLALIINHTARRRP